MISAETYNADYEKAVKFGYNRGIDEFAKKLREFCKTHEVSADKVRQLVYKRDGEWQWYDLLDEIAKRTERRCRVRFGQGFKQSWRVQT